MERVFLIRSFLCIRYMDNIPLFYWISICFANEFGKNAACPERGKMR
ncbi:hypothetical protein EBA29_02472 [Bacillus velezensis]|uniref:Uncharacterized protein n=1 Tax=Bacillus amyloliquefaciens (strain Y2) TaxID=1155777 RepID=I2C7U9_BACAY|nr:hypothetical protein MUS_2815 [Bacillus velezensis YAU B9601-Y2]AGZ57130.1 hypothetical protein U471_24320 [Bacillus amyloliquefaciens CC178]AHZ16649.1 hypothetical protein V529_26230 [Bacillus velezensis SQR9]ANF37333.1 hypothetical protein BCBMB205_24390 [Bacillus velezensis]EIF13950.1 hypothetical protein MY7_2283 [Bacillus sp. 5B6]KYC86693.1 hypothetical protein B4140_2369 [Bacillus amyloliquefaciens]GFR55939.1 hypothetical protein MY7_2283 [Bacillus sp. CN2]